MQNWSLKEDMSTPTDLLGRLCQGPKQLGDLGQGAPLVTLALHCEDRLFRRLAGLWLVFRSTQSCLLPFQTAIERQKSFLNYAWFWRHHDEWGLQDSAVQRPATDKRSACGLEHQIHWWVDLWVYQVLAKQGQLTDNATWIRGLKIHCFEPFMRMRYIQHVFPSMYCDCSIQAGNPAYCPAVCIP